VTKDGVEGGGFCSQCGSSLVEDSRFCSACGSAVRGRAPGRARAGGPARVSVVGLIALVVLASAVGAGVSFLFFVARDRAPQPVAITAPAISPATPAPAAAVEERGSPSAALPDRAMPRPGSFLEDLAKRAQAAPDDLRAWQQLARERYRAALLDRSKLAATADALDHVLELAPDDLEAIRMRADTAYDAGDYRTAADYFNRYLALAPGDRKVRLDLASALTFAGNAKAAKEIYHALIDEDDGFLPAYLGLGMVLYSEKDTEGAMTLFEKARRLARTSAEKSRVEDVIALAAPRKAE
jgi:Flp pilus assembly protein TadD